MREDILIPHTLQDGINIVGLTIFLIEFVVDGKIPGDLFVLQILSGQLLADCKAQFLVILQDLGEILPRTGRYHGQTVHSGLDLVKILGTDIQIADDAAADTVFQCIGLPRLIAWLNFDHFQAVTGGSVELPDAFVEAGWVAGGDHHPALRDLMSTKDFVLQEQQHGRGEGLRDAVDLVQKQNALRFSGGAHTVVDAGDDLAHGVFADLIVLAAVFLFYDHRQTQCALAGVVGHGIAHKAKPHLISDLLHNGGLAQARRTQQEDGPLMHQWEPVAAQSVLLQVDLYGIFDLLLCTCYIHDSVSSSVRVFRGSSRRMLSVVSTARMAQLGTWGLMWSSRLKMKAVL